MPGLLVKLVNKFWLVNFGDTSDGLRVIIEKNSLGDIQDLSANICLSKQWIATQNNKYEYCAQSFDQFITSFHDSLADRLELSLL